MAHNKIPPRWLNCPRRGQPVAGNRDRGVRVPAHGRVREWAEGVQLSVVVFQDRDMLGPMKLVWESGLEGIGALVKAKCCEQEGR